MAGNRALPLNHTTLPTPLSKAGLGIGGRLFLTPKGNTTSRKNVRELESYTGIAPSPHQKPKKENIQMVNKHMKQYHMSLMNCKLIRSVRYH